MIEGDTVSYTVLVTVARASYRAERHTTKLSKLILCLGELPTAAMTMCHLVSLCDRVSPEPVMESTARRTNGTSKDILCYCGSQVTLQFALLVVVG